MYIDIFVRIRVVYDVYRNIVPSVYSAQRNDRGMSASEHTHALYRKRAPARKSTPERERDVHTHCNASVCCSVLQCVWLCCSVCYLYNTCTRIVQPIPLGVTFSKAQSPKLESLFCHVSVKRDVRALSVELWNNIWKSHPKWDWLYLMRCTCVYTHVHASAALVYIVSNDLVPLCLMHWSLHCIWWTGPIVSDAPVPTLYVMNRSHCVSCTGPYIVSDEPVPSCLMHWSHCVLCTGPSASSYSKAIMERSSSPFHPHYGVATISRRLKTCALKTYVSFAAYSLFYRALLQKRPIVLKSLLIVATPYQSMCSTNECAGVCKYIHTQMYACSNV